MLFTLTISWESNKFVLFELANQNSLMRIIIACLVIMISLASCSTKKNTFTRRSYHNLTAHYNAYFNGNEALKEGVATLNKAHKDNYTRILEVFMYGEAKDAASVGPNMDRAVEKATKVINKHSMSFKNVEYVKWIDDSYLLIGKAKFFKRDYQGAIETFDFVSKKFSKNPIRLDAMLWMAKTYIAMGNYNKPAPILSVIENQLQEVNASSFVRRELPLVFADYYIKTKNLSLAADYLKKGIEVNSSKKVRVRLMFILAQIYQREGKLSEALEAYRDVIKKNPSYDIAFHAKIFAAQCYEAGSGSSSDIVKELYKMLKDRKNIDYKDEIYYALAEIAIKENRQDEGIDLLIKSANSSINNTYQKGMSYLRLAGLFFEKPDYLRSQAYYDSAMVVLPKDYPDYESIAARHKILSELVKNLNTIVLEDSLQKVAKMNEGERNALIDGLIADYIKQEELKKIREQEKLAAANNNNLNNNLASTNSNWYFYNPSTVSFGKNEFKKKWGDRPLEDLWRLTNKEVIEFTDPTNPDGNPNDGDTSGIASIIDPRDRSFYLKDVPFTPEKVDESNSRIRKAYFGAGMVYKDYLLEYAEAIKCFEKLLERFPACQFEADAWYHLNFCYSKMNNIGKANEYKQLLISKYPDSEYAMILTDPDYLIKKANQRSAADDYYNTLYSLYEGQQYGQVMESVRVAHTKFTGPEVMARFDFLNALAAGKLFGNDSLIALMTGLVKQYPGTESQKRAQQLLDYIANPLADGGNPSNNGGIEKTLYKPAPEDIHLFVLVLDVKSASVNNIKIMLSDFNATNFRNDELNVSSLYLTDKRIMFSVSHFSSLSFAMRYYEAFRLNENAQTTIQSTSPEFFVIAASNYPAFYKAKDEKGYLDFFKVFYLEN